MNNNNNITVRLFRPGTLGFEFNCAAFNTMRADDGGTHLLIRFDWEVPDGNGDFDRTAGAPNAIKEFMLNMEMNNKAVDNFDFDKPRISAKQYSPNGIWIDHIENLMMDVQTGKSYNY